MSKRKRIALLIDSEKNLLKIKEGIELLYEAKIQGVITWAYSCICDILKDPKGFNHATQEIDQLKVDIVIIVSNEENCADIVMSNLRHKYKNNTANVISVSVEQSSLNLIGVFSGIIYYGNMPEIKCAEFEKGRRLAPYEIMKICKE